MLPPSVRNHRVDVGSLQVRSTAIPTPSSSQILLQPTHVSLNHRDIFLRQHLYPSPSFTTPLLADAVCKVVDSPSQRVILNPSHGWVSAPEAPEKPFSILGGTSTNLLGTAQDYLVVEKDEVVPCPPHLSGPEAAALPLTGLTGWRALVTKSLCTESGMNLLVTGIGGGVALCVLQFAVAMGVRVWVTSGSEEKIKKAKELGAQGGVSYKAEKWEKDLKTLLPKDRPYLDAVIDGAAGDIVGRVVKLLKVIVVKGAWKICAYPCLARRNYRVIWHDNRSSPADAHVSRIVKH
jgi:NADPH:quinone reductase-like Zn-dependent oxidoreductase